MAIMTLKSDEARTKMRDILDEVTAGREVVIQRYNKPIGVMIPYDLWETFKEQEAILEAKRNLGRIRRGESKLTSHDELKRLMLEKQAAQTVAESSINVGD